MKIAHVTGSLSGTFMAKQLFMLKTPTNEAKIAWNNVYYGE